MNTNMHGQRGKCKSCQAEIVWGVTAADKLIPLNAQDTSDFRYACPKYVVTIETDEVPEKLFFIFKDRLILRDVYRKPPRCYNAEGNPVVAQQVQAWQTHFVTCPNSKMHKRGSARAQDQDVE